MDISEEVWSLGNTLSLRAGTKEKRGCWAYLADPRYPWDHQLEDELVLHRHLREEEVDLVIPAVPALRALSYHVSKHEAGLCREQTLWLCLCAPRARAPPIEDVGGCPHHTPKQMSGPGNGDGAHLVLLGLRRCPRWGF